MSNHLNLSTHSVKQLQDLAWQLKGTPAVQPIYRELSSRPWRGSIAADDPDWDAKVDQALREALGLPDQHSNNQEVAQ